MDLLPSALLNGSVMRLVIADDQDTFRRDLCGLLERYGFVVAGEAPNGTSAVPLARELKPDLTVIGLSVRGIGGVDATQAIADENPDARVLVLARSADYDEREVLDALLAGACGYLLKDAEAAEIVAGARAAAKATR